MDILAINTLRLLSVDMVQNANSGHPGMPLGCSPMTHLLFKNFLNFNPYNLNWINRDRFILSNGHGCALLYSILHMYKYNITLEDLKKFRQFGSITPGHPEKNITPGIEVTTGPLGQGFANGVGMALASKHLAARFNTDEFNIFNNNIFVMCGDGCLMEGITNEAASFAGHMKLNNLIVLYDDNMISIDGSTDLAFTENTTKKYQALGWNVITVLDGNNDFESINNAIDNATKSDKPTLICVKTFIGYGSDKENSEKSHGAPLGKESIENLKKKFNFNENETFHIPDKVTEYFKQITNNKISNYHIWEKLFEEYKIQHPEKYNELKYIINNKTNDIQHLLPSYTSDDDKMATRKISGICLQNIYQHIPQLIGGSADLSPSNNTVIDIGIQKNDYSKRYIHYGVREHAMCGIANGLSTFGLIPYVATFLVFINYCLASIRLSAISKHQVIYILTHDSIALGEDGPTHQPVESLSILRSIPNVFTFRPADGNEVSGCYNHAINNKNSPSCICLSRQSLPQLNGSDSNMVSKGGYILYETNKNINLILIASGSEVSSCFDVIKNLEKNNISIRLVSMPCTELFDLQPSEYKDNILPKSIMKISVEAGITNFWYKYADHCIGIDTFGASGKGNEVMDYFCLSSQKIEYQIISLLKNSSQLIV